MDRPIILVAKLTGKRSAGNPHAPFDEAGAGIAAMAHGMRSNAKAMEQPPEPTVVRQSSTLLQGCLQRIEEQRMLQALSGNPQSTGKSGKK
jgi:hypothetical protein